MECYELLFILQSVHKTLHMQICFYFLYSKNNNLHILMWKPRVITYLPETMSFIFIYWISSCGFNF